MKKIITLFILLFAALALFTGCSSSKDLGLDNIVVASDEVHTDNNEVPTSSNNEVVSEVIESDFIDDDIEIGELI